MKREKVILPKKIFPLRKGLFFVLSIFLLVNCQEKASKIMRSPKNLGIQKVTSFYHRKVDSTIALIEKYQNLQNVAPIKKDFSKIRQAFKGLEPIMAFIDQASYGNLNAPNIPEIEEEDNAQTIERPTGFQVLEEILFDSDSINLKAVNSHLNNILLRLKFHRKAKNNLSFLKDYHFLWMFRDSFTRIMTLGITGFDSPIIQNSLPESQAVFKGLREYLHFFKPKFNDTALYNQFQKQLHNAQIILGEGSFKSFDRYHFIKNNIHPLLKTWTETVEDWKVSFPFKQPINYSAVSYFSPDTFNYDYFSSPNTSVSTPEKIALGKRLFFNPILSKDKKMSCASCHQPAHYFTDGLTKSIGNNGKPVKRNSPTLLYADLQQSLFHDGRVNLLENQILAVAMNKDEFHLPPKEAIKAVRQDSSLMRSLKKLYPNELITAKHIRLLIADYLRTLNPFNSKFDQNISGNKNNLTPDEIAGFNLFMGKAICATCHHPPIFNGTIPPRFKKSEIEILGVPKSIKWKNASVDEDLGRYNVYKVELKKHAFKTPTVRNSAKTAPYMHNGVYKDLNEIIRFYNVGGGAGIGINLENQTLPPQPLELSEKEQKQLVDFLNSLTDSIQI